MSKPGRYRDVGLTHGLKIIIAVSDKNHLFTQRLIHIYNSFLAKNRLYFHYLIILNLRFRIVSQTSYFLS